MVTMFVAVAVLPWQAKYSYAASDSSVLPWQAKYSVAAIDSSVLPWQAKYSVAESESSVLPWKAMYLVAESESFLFCVMEDDAQPPPLSGDVFARLGRKDSPSSGERAAPVSPSGPPNGSYAKKERVSSEQLDINVAPSQTRHPTGDLPGKEARPEMSNPVQIAGSGLHHHDWAIWETDGMQSLRQTGDGLDLLGGLLYEKSGLRWKLGRFGDL